MRPYNDVRLNRQTLLREFNARIDDIEYTWHRDEDDRIIEVFSGAGWQLQLDNQLPVLLESGCEYRIPAGMWHRLHKGSDNLTILISEGKKKKKKADGMRSVRKGADKNPKVTRMDFLPDDVLDDIAKEKNESNLLEASSGEMLICPRCGTENHQDEEACTNCGLEMGEEHGGQGWLPATNEGKKKSSHHRNYGAPEGSKRAKQLDMTKADMDSEDPERIARGRRRRDRMEKQEREKMAESTIRLTANQLSELISETVEAEKLALMLEKVEELEEKKKRKKKKSGKSSKGLSKAVKKSLDKKADKRCLTRGSVYAEFRKGLAAYYTSGSRKGMSAHQWAHARVNSANPSKSWASVKKRKKCPKKKKSKK